MLVCGEGDGVAVDGGGSGVQVEVTGRGRSDVRGCCI